MKNILLLLATVLILGCNHPKGDDLEQVFANPPESTKPWCYWYWLNDNISKEGITKDLEAMAKVGIGEALIGNILDETIVTRGNVKVLTTEWWAMVEHAIREADRLGIKVGLFNCPGWSQSGGPWIKPEQAMRYLVSSELIVKGPQTFSGKLPVPKTPFQQVSVQAFPLNQEEKKGVSSLSPKVSVTPGNKDATNLFDGNVQTAFDLQGYPLTVDVELEKPLTLRSMQIYPRGPLSAICDLQIPDNDGSFHTIATCDIDRENLNAHVGPMVFGPLSESFPAVTSKKFRLVFNKREHLNLPFTTDNITRSLGQIGEINLSGSALSVELYRKAIGENASHTKHCVRYLQVGQAGGTRRAWIGSFPGSDH